ncbi:uncharacterized protein PG986_002282 [Apiospora aurea]|uniref:Uncharacterized protein n=1 Tax=Apiospora aurea TaxID=335848 RepID=A0ABR1QZ98_9PEZI
MEPADSGADPGRHRDEQIAAQLHEISQGPAVWLAYIARQIEAYKQEFENVEERNEEIFLPRARESKEDIVKNTGMFSVLPKELLGMVVKDVVNTPEFIHFLCTLKIVSPGPPEDAEFEKYGIESPIAHELRAWLARANVGLDPFKVLLTIGGEARLATIPFKPEVALFYLDGYLSPAFHGAGSDEAKKFSRKEGTFDWADRVHSALFPLSQVEERLRRLIELRAGGSFELAHAPQGDPRHAGYTMDSTLPLTHLEEVKIRPDGEVKDKGNISDGEQNANQYIYQHIDRLRKAVEEARTKLFEDGKGRRWLANLATGNYSGPNPISERDERYINAREWLYSSTGREFQRSDAGRRWLESPRSQKFHLYPELSHDEEERNDTKWKRKVVALDRDLHYLEPNLGSKIKFVRFKGLLPHGDSGSPERYEYFGYDQEMGKGNQPIQRLGPS